MNNAKTQNKEIIVATKVSKDSYSLLILFAILLLGFSALAIDVITKPIKQAIILSLIFVLVFLLLTLIMVRVIYIHKELIFIKNNKLYINKELSTYRIDINKIKKIYISKFGKESITKILIETNNRVYKIYYKFSEEEFTMA